MNDIELITFSAVEQCKNQLKSFLQSNEALNSILIGALLQANNAAILSLGACYRMSLLEIAWMLTHEKVLMLTEGTEKTLHSLADHFSKQSLDIYRIRGSAFSVDTFIRLSCLIAFKSMIQNVYQLDKIILQKQSLGLLRKAELTDITCLVPWIEQYITEAKLDYVKPNSLLKNLIEKERLYLWENNKTIVSMAACSGPTYRGIRINLVFTSPHYRGNGYASSCVAALGNHLLEHGYDKCFIFADKENHTANSIYKKIGFTLVGSYKDCTLVIPK